MKFLSQGKILSEQKYINFSFHDFIDTLVFDWYHVQLYLLNKTFSDIDKPQWAELWLKSHQTIERGYLIFVPLLIKHIIIENLLKFPDPHFCSLKNRGSNFTK